MRLTAEAIAELRTLEDRRGRLTAEQVVDVARNETSALHGCFEWDDSKPAESYRIEQARELIRRVKIEITIQERTIKTVAYVRDPDKDASLPGYQNTLKVTTRGAADLMRAELAAISADMERAVGLAYAKDAAGADRAALMKAAVARDLGIEVSFCGTRGHGGSLSLRWG